VVLVPSKQQDIVIINETYGTPRNANKAHGHSVNLTYTNGDLTQVDEVMDGVLRKRTTLNYNDGDLTSVNEKIYALDGSAVEIEYTDSLSYSGGDLVSVSRTVL
jgi:hypothetical protein